MLEDEFEIRVGGEDPAEQVASLARLLQGKLPGLDYQFAGMQVAGASPVGSRRRRQFSRAHAEGAALYVVREHLQSSITLGDPKAFAAKLGEKKDDFIERAQELSKSKADAAMAAIAAFP